MKFFVYRQKIEEFVINRILLINLETLCIHAKDYCVSDSDKY